MQSTAKDYQTQKVLSDFATEQQNSLNLSSLKPWHFKPKKSKFMIEGGAKTSKKFNSSHWSLNENIKYAQFLEKYSQLLNSQVPEKRKYHLNRMMSKHVQTRSPTQCRSHHQKMLASYGTVKDVIAHFISINQEDFGEGINMTEHLEREDSAVKNTTTGQFESSFLLVQNPILLASSQFSREEDSCFWNCLQPYDGEGSFIDISAMF